MKSMLLSDGIKFDASIGIGEDMADISGMGIVSRFLANYHIYYKTLPLIAKLSMDEYFIYYAYQQRQQVSNKALRAQLKTNPHPLDKYRCNVPLSRTQLFRKLYNVKKGDGMWWSNTSLIW